MIAVMAWGWACPWCEEALLQGGGIPSKKCLRKLAITSSKGWVRRVVGGRQKGRPFWFWGVHLVSIPVNLPAQNLQHLIFVCERPAELSLFCEYLESNSTSLEFNSEQDNCTSWNPAISIDDNTVLTCIGRMSGLTWWQWLVSSDYT